MKKLARATKPLLVLIVLSSASSSLALPVLDFDERTGRNGSNSNQSVGWQFDVLEPITVTGLGWYDEDADGLALGHDVGIWSPTGALLASALVPSGVIAPLAGQFRTVAIPSLTLPAASGYIVGGENFSTNTERLAGNVLFSIDARVRFVNPTFAPVGNGFTRPTSFSVASSGIYGPSFSIVPEPSTIILVFTSASFLFGIRYHKFVGCVQR